MTDHSVRYERDRRTAAELVDAVQTGYLAPPRSAR